MALSTITIKTNGSALARNWKVFLGDSEITHYLHRLEISGDVHEIAKVNLYCIAKIELPDVLQAMVAATRKEFDMGLFWAFGELKNGERFLKTAHSLDEIVALLDSISPEWASIWIWREGRLEHESDYSSSIEANEIAISSKSRRKKES